MNQSESDRLLIKELERQLHESMNHQRIMLAGLALQGRLASCPPWPHDKELNEKQIDTITSDSMRLADSLMSKLLKK